MRILVTGSRDWADREKVWSALNEAATFGAMVVHGDCPTGADALAQAWTECQPDVNVERFPADWAKHGKAAGPIRNQEMVDFGADLCLAFPLGASRGTRDCMRRAEAAGIPVKVIEP